MKENGNDKRVKEYYVGLDVGTNSVGWAVTDQDYNVSKFKGKSMWGARLFDEAEKADGRRTAREARRRLDRRNQRLLILESLFAEEIAKIDNGFYVRLHDSSLYQEDKTDDTCKYSLFCDLNYTDKDYLKQYPTIYHLRSELVHSSDPHDVRLVFLALHHLLKSRGHFLYANSENANGMTLGEAIDELESYLNEYNLSLGCKDLERFKSVLQSLDTLTSKKKQLGALCENGEDADSAFDVKVLVELLAGAKIKLSKLFKDEALDDADVNKVCLEDDLSESFDALSQVLADRMDLILHAKEVFDIAKLNGVLRNKTYISDAKIELYEENSKKLKVLKNWMRKNNPKQYKEVFNAKEGVKNFAAYTRYKTGESCTQEEMCSFVLKACKDMEKSKNAMEQEVYQELKAKTFYPKLKGSENGLIPYQIQMHEFDKIVENASAYLPFLNEADQDGITVAQKLHDTFVFRIPYYVGPLNRKSERAWVVRTDEKIYPWNFSRVVDEQASANVFMENRVGRCTYTGDPVLPKDSLLYCEYMVLNSINSIKLNGNPIPVDVKLGIYSDLFLASGKRVSKKRIVQYLLSKGLMEKDDQITGIDDMINADLKPYRDFQRILEKTKDKAQVERIIQSVLVFGENKRMLRSWLKANTKVLNSQDIQYVCRLNYKEWGRLSRTFLEEIYDVNENGEARSIMDMLRNTNNNLMQLMSDEYQFAHAAEEYRKEAYGTKDTLRGMLDDLYIAPAVRRSIWQTMRIVDEIADIQKGAPKKIFIEMARTSSKEMKKKRTESRKDTLLKLYESCKGQEKELYERLQKETNQSLRRDKLYLYYTQFGRCMYSMKPIDFEAMMKDDQTYDIDHIYPRSRIKDDSLTNRVLVCSTLNREKTNSYPIKDDVREKMHGFWGMLHDRHLINDEKYKRLTRNYPLTDEELSSFVARQLVETQQSTKALATILSAVYPKSKIVYSKAGNVSDFRNEELKMVKVRDINDLHHAKDAYLNIVVGNVYDTKFTSQFFKNIHNENYSLKKVFAFDTKTAWKADGTSITTVRKYMVKNNPIVTFAPYKNKGELFDLQILKKGKGQQPIKTGKDIEKYGGYNNIKGSYFCLVEHTKKGKRVRTIVPVYGMLASVFERDPQRYLQIAPNLELGENPVVVQNCIRINSLVEMNGSRLMIVARTGGNNIYLHSYQFAVNDETAKYLKDVSKYVDRCAVEKTTLPVTDYDGISAEKNGELYDWLIERLGASVYSVFFTNLQSQLKEGRSKFKQMDLRAQAQILLEVLKAFKCNATYPNLDALNGKKTVGRISKSSDITSCESYYLIHQSVTGLFEKKIDLLK